MNNANVHPLTHINDPQNTIRINPLNSPPDASSIKVAYSTSSTPLPLSSTAKNLLTSMASGMATGLAKAINAFSISLESRTAFIKGFDRAVDQINSSTENIIPQNMKDLLNYVENSLEKGILFTHDKIDSHASSLANYLVPQGPGFMADLERAIAKGFGKFLCLTGGILNMSISLGAIFAGFYIGAHICAAGLPFLIVACALGGLAEGAFLGAHIADYYKEWVQKNIGTEHPAAFGSITLGAIGFLIGACGFRASLGPLNVVTGAPSMGISAAEAGIGKIMYLSFAGLAEGIGTSFFLVGNAFIKAADIEENKDNALESFAKNPMTTLALGCYYFAIGVQKLFSPPENTEEKQRAE